MMFFPDENHLTGDISPTLAVFKCALSMPQKRKCRTASTSLLLLRPHTVNKRAHKKFPRNSFGCCCGYFHQVGRLSRETMRISLITALLFALCKSVAADDSFEVIAYRNRDHAIEECRQYSGAVSQFVKSRFEADTGDRRRELVDSEDCEEWCEVNFPHDPHLCVHYSNGACGGRRRRELRGLEAATHQGCVDHQYKLLAALLDTAYELSMSSICHTYYMSNWLTKCFEYVEDAVGTD